MADDDQQQIHDDFRSGVNMTRSQLEKWLETEESQSVGQKKGGSGESTGHEYGRRIVGLLGKDKGDLTDDDYADMKKVTGYIHRHAAQRPDGDVTGTPWRYSLMNWGHDPTK